MHPLHPRTLLAGLFLLSTLPGPVSAELSERWQKMNQPVEPFRILGNLYYVGANDVTSFLITTPAGHILIDGGFDETVPLIEASVERLGFRFEDVEILLNSHGHFDHAGGLARIQRATGARFMASGLEAPILERGGLGDDLLGDEGTFPADPRRSPSRGRRRRRARGHASDRADHRRPHSRLHLLGLRGLGGRPVPTSRSRSAACRFWTA